MSTTTTISWATKTWNPTVGCSRVDHRCDHCYAINVAHRQMTPSHVGLTKLRVRGSRPGPDWNGKVRMLPGRLEDPFRWRAPQRVFVDSMSDLFHPKVPDDFIARVFAVMESCERHTFLVLTKRPERLGLFARGMRVGRNIQLGVSVSDQGTWKDVEHLLYIDAAVRWVSLEPMLGPVDMRARLRGLDWVVLGGESGPGARPYDVDWARYAIEQCCNAGVPVFHKQLGSRPMASVILGRDFEWPEGTRFTTAKGHMGTQWQGRFVRLHDTKGETMDEWPESLRVRQYPEVD